MAVNYVGLNSLDEIDRERLKKIVSKYGVDIKRLGIKNALKFHVKTHEVGGRVRYNFRTHLSVGKDVLNSEVEGWTIKTNVHSVMRKLLTAAEHKFHVMGQKQQKFHPKKAKDGFGKRVKMKIKGLVKFI
ncbi:hypothetical protein HOM13_01725 [Candidatus Woesearchaeota archaeon]|jgi:hypothetical protein|nr:hypothetical protein [Candidatus Woesearchaeota archaeon]MBT5215434.1 hypothetical protein [Candidatus Woesearchaeota archaeon]MBT6402035.1 hypothetical protein [Candidatus Woesearchaeota archaeon]